MIINLKHPHHPVYCLHIGSRPISNWGRTKTRTRYYFLLISQNPVFMEDYYWHNIFCISTKYNFSFFWNCW
jgi:hypothetical protein